MPTKTKKTVCTKRKTATKKTGSNTKIIVRYDCGLPNNLYIRGEGMSTMSWNKGQPMKNIAPDTWVWETKRPFSSMECKIVLNDIHYELGENHTVHHGQELVICPSF